MIVWLGSLEEYIRQPYISTVFRAYIKGMKVLQDKEMNSYQYVDEEREDGSSSLSDLLQLTEEELLTQMIEEPSPASQGGNGEPQHAFLEPLYSSMPDLAVPYHPRHHDQAIREASFAHEKLWKERGRGLVSYLATNNIEVAIQSQDLPLALSEARKAIEQLGENTVIVSRILFLLWNIRHKQVQRKGNSVPILISEVLRLMGHNKHVKGRYTDGYRPEQKRKVIEDVALLSSLLVRATILEEGHPTPLNILSPYLTCSLVTKGINGEHHVVGFYVGPGDWIKAYEAFPEQATDTIFARIDQAIYQLDTHNEKYAIRIALFLTERWRDHVLIHQEALLRGNPLATSFAMPIKMIDLLAGSMIAIPREHVRDRFIPRIERALQMLITPPYKLSEADQAGTEQQRILGSASPMTAVDRQQARWDQTWLMTDWELLPPSDLLNACTIIESSQATQQKARKVKKRAGRKRA